MNYNIPVSCNPINEPYGLNHIEPYTKPCMEIACNQLRGTLCVKNCMLRWIPEGFVGNSTEKRNY